MEFLQPLALLGLAAAAVPALLHLLQRRQPPTLVFPAVRYLVEAEERHSRRVRLRNLLLLLLRTALIATIALAAARPILPSPLGRAHAPSAVVVVLDNSLSSGAVAGGQVGLAALRQAARAVGAAAGSGDHLWLLTAEGTPRRMAVGEWRGAVDEVAPVARRLDLGTAVRAAAAVVRAQSLPGGVLVLSDLQATALSDAGDIDVPVVIRRPVEPPANRGIGPVRIEPESWTSGGIVVAALVGDDTSAAEVQLHVGGVARGRALAGAGSSVVLPVDQVGPGWHRARLAITADELRADDAVEVAVHASSPAAVRTRNAGAFVDAALAVLRETGRVREGPDVVMGDGPDAGPTIVLPPSDPARVAAVNQALAARGVPVRFGAVETGEWMLASPLFRLDGAAVRRRYRLLGGGTVLASADGAPWIVRADDIVIVASRFEEGWTDVPLRPEFLPFLDAIINRVGAGEVWRVTTAPGEAVHLAGSARRLLLPAGPLAVSATVPVEAPLDPGAYFVTDAVGDTVGALQVQPDPRESDLRTADLALARALLGEARLVDGDRALVHAAFANRRAELTTGLLVIALLLAAVELVVASVGGAARVRA